MIIRILKTNTPLTLCEVEVYSERRGIIYMYIRSVHALIYSEKLFLSYETANKFGFLCLILETTYCTFQ